MLDKFQGNCCNDSCEMGMITVRKQGICVLRISVQIRYKTKPKSSHRERERGSERERVRD
eukprot:785602-Rhodomonas_salina.1